MVDKSCIIFRQACPLLPTPWLVDTTCPWRVVPGFGKGHQFRSFPLYQKLPKTGSPALTDPKVSSGVKGVLFQGHPDRFKGIS